MRPLFRALRYILVVGLASQASACASFDAPGERADKMLLRYSRVVQAQSAFAQAQTACVAAGAASEAEACHRRAELAAELRRQGYCHRPGSPEAADEARRYSLWTACDGSGWS